MSDSLCFKGTFSEISKKNKTVKPCEGATKYDHKLMEHIKNTNQVLILYGMPNEFVQYAQYYGVRYMLQTTEALEWFAHVTGAFHLIPVKMQDLDPQILQKAARLQVQVLTDKYCVVPTYVSKQDHEMMIDIRDSYFVERSQLLLSQIKSKQKNFDFDALVIDMNREAHYIITYQDRMTYVPNMDTANLEKIVAWLFTEPVKVVKPEPSYMEDMYSAMIARPSLADATDQVEMIREKPKLEIGSDDIKVFIGTEQVQTLAMDIIDVSHARVLAEKQEDAKFLITKPQVCDIKTVRLKDVNFSRKEWIIHPGTQTNDILCCLARMGVKDVEMLIFSWFRKAVIHGGFPMLVSADYYEQAIYLTEYTEEHLPTTCVSSQYAARRTFHPPDGGGIMLVVENVGSYRETNGVITEGFRILVFVERRANTYFRLSFEAPAGLYSDDNTLYTGRVSEIRVTEIPPTTKREVLRKSLDRYRIYEIDWASLALDGVNNVRSSGYIYWVNIIVDGKWYGSRPFITDLDSCRSYDPGLKIRTDIAHVIGNMIAIQGYKQMSRIHLLNSKVFN